MSYGFCFDLFFLLARMCRLPVLRKFFYVTDKPGGKFLYPNTVTVACCSMLSCIILRYKHLVCFLHGFSSFLLIVTIVDVTIVDVTIVDCSLYTGSDLAWKILWLLIGLFTQSPTLFAWKRIPPAVTQSLRGRSLCQGQGSAPWQLQGHLWGQSLDSSQVLEVSIWLLLTCSILITFCAKISTHIQCEQLPKNSMYGSHVGCWKWVHRNNVSSYWKNSMNSSCIGC